MYSNFIKLPQHIVICRAIEGAIFIITLTFLLTVYKFIYSIIFLSGFLTLNRNGVDFSMAKIQISENESLREALRRFKKMCDKEGIINQSKRYAYFEKPSDKRRREESRRVKNIKKAQNLNPNLFSS
ncbi:MAG: 30S ribosomal protein S21 [Candidatus Scalindua rubra]|uniref:Small ribosomal subunit protein bS21 n=1 Tax=Candidatus Scalindua rubra TaxID=1872076 RepID=A0A1E3X8E1_9BACT|nr:MAG: 30S ribosomal protein S21 [Candidatus Scalindua rubra]